MVIGYNVHEQDTIAKASPSKAVRHASEAARTTIAASGGKPTP
jgi:hypothetical protein